LPKENDLLQQRLREEARALFLQKKNKELLSNEELDVSYKILLLILTKNNSIITFQRI
jgi:serine/threonine-protein phosphatase 2A regulatory subunit B''/actin-binding protein anillin